jgi:hypothetical protein
MIDWSKGHGYFGHLKEYMSVGDTFTVLRETIGVYRDGTEIPSYKFVEIGGPECFDKRNFSPLSDIDETELVNERVLVESVL